MKTMRLLPFFVAAACAGPGQQRLSETPTARTKPVAAEAPAPAGTADADRQRVGQQFDDMNAAQQAHREAANTPEAPPPRTPVSPPGATGSTATPAAQPASPDRP